MEQQIVYVSFGILRNAYLEVKDFFEPSTIDGIKSLKTKLESEAGVNGDELFELLEVFCMTYGLRADGFTFEEYFHTEYELWEPISMFINLVSGKRKVPELTFRDLITWYLSGNFKQAGEVRYLTA